MKVHAITAPRLPQFWRHLRPIFEALPDDLRGERFEVPFPVRRIPEEDVFLVAAYGNVINAGGRRVIYVEHGAGQSYKGTKRRISQSYPGGPHEENVIGYISPNQIVADSWGRPAVAAGCPALDRVGPQRGGHVVVTFHWDAPTVCPEARSARPHYIDHLHHLQGWLQTAQYHRPMIGHAHPRDRWAKGIWEKLGVPFEPDPDEALRRASLVIADNTSFAYEATNLDISNISLNAPWYRRDVEHGLRFWSHPPGIMVDDIWDLMSRDVDEYLYGDENMALRKAAAKRAYSHKPKTGGTKAAVEFIVGLVG